MAESRKPYSYVEEWKRRWDPDLKAIGVKGNSCDPTKVDPKVLDWAKENCTNNPHFIKVINNGAANGRPGLKQTNASSITVPSPFVREHFKRLGRVVTLENDRGRTWRVSFGSATKRDPQWLQGWEKVATDNDFRPGDVVVFNLVADSRFQFTRFDEDGNMRTSSDLQITTPEKIAELRPPRKVRKLVMQEADPHDEPPGSNSASTTEEPVLNPDSEPTFDPLAFTWKSKMRLATPSS